MKPAEMNFLMETLETDHQNYYYFKDKYALDLLSLNVKEEISVADLKKSQWGFLTEKTPVKQVLANCGKKRVSADMFEGAFHERDFNFTYTLGKWGKYEKSFHDSWFQTSRNGENLVLQLNFDRPHVNEYFKLVNPDKDDHPFVFDSHPVLEKSGFTLGWARLDVDLETGEVLIEEIQNDWLREAKTAMIHAKSALERNAKKEASERKELKWAVNEIKYYDSCLKDYLKLWDEAILNLAIQFIVDELGCQKIYYHTFDSGNILKGLGKDYTKPPKSLYTKLPKRFGFQETDEVPEMLKNDKKLRKKLRNNELKWQKLFL